MRDRNGISPEAGALADPGAFWWDKNDQKILLSTQLFQNANKTLNSGPSFDPSQNGLHPNEILDPPVGGRRSGGTVGRPSTAR